MSIVNNALSFGERVCAYLQGKGYGSGSIQSEIRGIEKLLGSGKGIQVAVDIGANVGNYTARLVERYPQAEIYTIEPSKTNIQKLKERFDSNSNVTIVPYAVSNERGKSVLYSNEAGSGLGSLVKRRLDHFGIDFDVEESVETIRFEDYWRENLRSREIDILKLDIEGHELAALEGCGDSLEKTKAIQFEFGGCNIDTRTYFQDFWYFFSKRGFYLYRISPFGVTRIPQYKERDEFFSTTNYIAIKK